MTDPVGGTEPSQGRKPTEAQLVMPRGGNRGLQLGTIAVAAILALAVLKPWAEPGHPAGAVEEDTPSARPAGVAAFPVPAAIPSAKPPGWDAPGGQCFVGDDWSVFAIEMRSGRRLRHWLAVEPRAAGGPGDPAVPFVRIVTDKLLALGFCVGPGSDGTGRSVAARAWALAAGSPARPVALSPLVAQMPREPNLGAVYRPPTATRGTAGAGWAPGRYVFSVRQGPAERDERWFGVEVVVAPRATPAP